MNLVGPLPAEVQNYTSYAAAPMTGTPGADHARDFLRFLATAQSKALFAAAGVD